MKSNICPGLEGYSSWKWLRQQLPLGQGACFFIILFFFLAGKLHGQRSDTIFVYDTIVVHDTIIVYDTVNVSASQSPQQAILEFDTANQKVQLKIFNSKDTATIPVNSIIVSETKQNSQTKNS